MSNEAYIEPYENNVANVFEIDGTVSKEFKFDLKYKVRRIDGKRFQVLVSLPFSFKSTVIKSDYGKEANNWKKYVLERLEGKLRSKYNAVKLRAYNNEQRFNKFKELINIPENEYINKYSHDLNHKELYEKIGDKTIGEIFKDLDEVKKTNKLSDIPKNFNLTWNRFLEILIQDNCAYCGVSIKNINDLSDKGKLFTKRARGYTMEVDQMEAYGNYSDENCVAACYWCNNAKTDEYTDEEFLPIAKGINIEWNIRLREVENSGDSVVFPKKKECQDRIDKLNNKNETIK